MEPGEDDRRVLVQEIEIELEEEFPSNSNGINVYKKEWCENSNSTVYLSAGVAAIGGILFGYDVGVISGAKVQVAHVMELTCGQEESLVSFMPLGALSASLVASRLINRYGRKCTIQLTAVAFTAGSVLMAFADSFPILLVGRFVVGFAVSLSAMAECLYISEISKPKNRGMLVSLNELGITLGFLFAFLVNYAFIQTQGGWRIMFGLSSGLAVLQLVAMYFLPRTPHYLVLRGRDAEATAVLRRIYPQERVKQEMSNIRQSVETAIKSSYSQLFSTQENLLHRSMIGLTLVVLLQVTGQPNILYYATDIFEAVGFCGESLATMATVGLGVMKVASTLLSLLLVDKVGRRSLLLLGAACMAVCLLALTIFAAYQYSAVGYHYRETCSHTYHPFPQNVSAIEVSVSANDTSVMETVQPSSYLEHGNNYNNPSFINMSKNPHTHKNLFSHVQHVVVEDQNNTSNNDDSTSSSCVADYLPFGLRYLAFVALILCVAAFSFSFGPVTWILLTELFPVSLKGEALSLAQAVNWTANVFVSVTFLDSVRVLTLPFVFFVYFVFACLAIVFVYKFVPETKGKSLEEISNQLKELKMYKPAVKTRSERKRSRPSFSNTADFMQLQDSPF